MTPLRLGLGLSLAFVVGVGQIIEGDRRFQVKEGPCRGEHVILDAFLVGEQAVRGPVEGHVAETAKVQTEHLACGARSPQPAVGLALRGRMRHASDDAGQGTAALAPVEAQLVEQAGKTKHVEGRKGGMLDADGAPRRCHTRLRHQRSPSRPRLSPHPAAPAGVR